MKCKTNKITYRSRKSAWNASLQYYRRFYNLSSAYHCNLCGKFHLTTKSILPPPKEMKDPFEKVHVQLLDIEWKMLRKILNIKTNKEKKRLYKQSYRPSRLSLWWLKIRNRYFRWLGI